MEDSNCTCCSCGCNHDTPIDDGIKRSVYDYAHAPWQVLLHLSPDAECAAIFKHLSSYVQTLDIQYIYISIVKLLEKGGAIELDFFDNVGYLCHNTPELAAYADTEVEEFYYLNEGINLMLSFLRNNWQDKLFAACYMFVLEIYHRSNCNVLGEQEDVSSINSASDN